MIVVIFHNLKIYVNFLSVRTDAPFFLMATMKSYNHSPTDRPRCDALPDDHEFISIGAYSKLSPDTSSDTENNLIDYKKKQSSKILIILANA